MKISVVILTKNEEKNIAECIDSVGFVDEIIVIDDYSSDKTAEVGEELGGIVYKRKLNSDFAAQRNYGLKKSNGDWILFVDADERISRALASEIIQTINNPTLEFDGFYLRRVDSMWGRKLNYGEFGGVKLLRLARKDSGNWVRRVHEVWRVEGNTYNLSNPILHYPHPTVRDFVRHINSYSTLHAQANKEEGKKSNLLKIMFWPPGKFFYNYFFKLGFLDGLSGFVSAIIMSFSSYLAWGKLWLKQEEN
ncbi:glycosyltransferase family 2 protein [Patescibacteria group bacterium]|nr:glycosyltransferase family 2 protein [Patescibacteria group bacterium]